MLDFPSPATNGQLFNNWRYDGTKWVPASGLISLPDAPQDSNTYGRRNAAWNSVDAMLAPVNATANAALNDAGRNLLQNPIFTVQQRGTGAFTTNGVYTADRWYLGVSSDTVSVNVSAIADGGRTAIGDETAAFALSNVFTGNSAAAAQSFIEQRIENVRRLAGKTVTLSFWASTAAGGLKLGINAVQSFGSGGSPSAAVIVLATGNAIALSTSWTRYTTTFAIPSIVGKTLGTAGDYTAVRFYYSSGATANVTAGNIGVQSGTIYLWGVQLEYGSVATPLDYGGSPQDQLRQCQRFYQIGQFALSGYAGAGSGFAYAMMPPVAMRAAPTVTTSGTATSNTGAITAAAYGSSINFSAVGTATGPAAIQGSFQLSADL